jgi:hypothetical protein
VPSVTTQTLRYQIALLLKQLNLELATDANASLTEHELLLRGQIKSLLTNLISAMALFDGHLQARDRAA